MEINQHGFIEELLNLRRDDLQKNNFQTEIGDIFSNGSWSFNDDVNYNSQPTLLPCNSLLDQDFESFYFNGVSCPFEDDRYFSTPTTFSDDHFQFTDSPYNNFDTPSFPVQEDQTPLSVTMEDDQEMGLLQNQVQDLKMTETCKAEPTQSNEVPVFSAGTYQEKKIRGKKLEGQPSKNLMAERRRRKRLNDRLSMLRSIVPKISKMDRTSILGDTIDYVKELLGRINNLKQEVEVGSNQLSILKDTKASEFTVRNSPKFDVERRKEDTEIEIYCGSKPGLLLSTVNTLEALGLEIQHCVISCFNDFTFQASCSEELEQREVISCEDIKQALFVSAGYGGRYL